MRKGRCGRWTRTLEVALHALLVGRATGVRLLREVVRHADRHPVDVDALVVREARIVGGRPTTMAESVPW